MSRVERQRGEGKADRGREEDREGLLICEQKCVCKIYKCYTDIWAVYMSAGQHVN